MKINSLCFAEQFDKNLPALLLAGIAYLAAALAIGRELLPESSGFALLLIWASAQLGGVAVKQVYLPPLMGMLLSGVILANLPGNLIDDLPDSWSTKIRAGALAVILMRYMPLCTRFRNAVLTTAPFRLDMSNRQVLIQVGTRAGCWNAYKDWMGCSQADVLPRCSRSLGGRRRGCPYLLYAVWTCTDPRIHPGSSEPGYCCIGHV